MRDTVFVTNFPVRCYYFLTHFSKWTNRANFYKVKMLKISFVVMSGLNHGQI